MKVRHHCSSPLGFHHSAWAGTAPSFLFFWRVVRPCWVSSRCGPSTLRLARLPRYGVDPCKWVGQGVLHFFIFLPLRTFRRLFSPIWCHRGRSGPGTGPSPLETCTKGSPGSFRLSRWQDTVGGSLEHILDNPETLLFYLSLDFPFQVGSSLRG